MSKLDELKEKFEGFIEEIKAKIPSKKKSDEDEDFDDEFEESTGQVEVDPEALEDEATQTDAEIGESTIIDSDEGTQTEVEVDEDDDEEDEEDEDEDEKKKKQKSLIIKGLLGVVLLYLVYDTFMGGDSGNELPPPPQNAVKKRKRPPRKRRPKPNTQANKEAPQVNQQAKAPAPTGKPSNPAPTPTKAPEPTIAPAPKVVATPEPTPEPTVEPKVVATPEPEPTPSEPEAKIEEPVAMDAEAIPPETPKEPMDSRMGEKKTVKVENALAMDEKVDEILTKSVKEQMKKSANEKIDEAGIDPNMTYVEPPNYRRVGRGLIYNCIGRHWACVDKFAYFQCRENTKWSTVNNKEPECVVSNVYASEKDCGVVQLHYINTNEPTDFCKGQTSENESSAPKTKVVVP